MRSIAIKASRLKLVVILILGLGFVALGVFILTFGKPKDSWIGWMSIVFFGSMIPLVVWQLFDSRPRLVINDQGINDRTLGVGLIPWDEITGAYLMSIQGNCFICLDLRDPDSWLEKLPPIKRAMSSANVALGFSPFSLNMSGVAIDPIQVHELILKTIELRYQN